MADYDRTILDFYQLPTPYPSEWPAEKDAESSDDDDDMAKKVKQRKSRYQALERAVSGRRSLVPNSDGGKGGLGTLVQSDEPDPLGSSDSVVRQLALLGVPVKDDARLRTSPLATSYCSRCRLYGVLTIESRKSLYALFNNLLADSFPLTDAH